VIRDDDLDLVTTYLALRLCILTAEHPRYPDVEAGRLADWKAQLADTQSQLIGLGLARRSDGQPG